ncbi:Bacteriophage CI repressor helix-turn-helix domain [Serratia odorifera]|uniref:Bacteriophage CI repressor helix-turn-helix domain n=2 Tax=Serratia odorifera TaxID=618 RepID=A0A447L1I9_SEROD|nr:Bacteriophage CI repressor helix-turn-helix domain [Serratia odorifera]
MITACLRQLEKYTWCDLMDLEKGGRGAIERMVEAYGFTTRQALCDQLGVSKGTLANRYMRDSFPAEWVIQCALETGFSLQWLVTGTGTNRNDIESDIIDVPRKKIIAGKLFESNKYFFDKAILPNKYKKLFCLDEENTSYILDEAGESITDGKWIINIDGSFYLKDITRIPGNRILVSSKESNFECLLEEIKFLAKVVVVITKK